MSKQELMVDGSQAKTDWLGQRSVLRVLRSPLTMTWLTQVVPVFLML